MWEVMTEEFVEKEKLLKEEEGEEEEVMFERV